MCVFAYVDLKVGIAEHYWTLVNLDISNDSRNALTLYVSSMIDQTLRSCFYFPMTPVLQILFPETMMI